uniref:Uncharacterized protein n=1 Tax=Setaria digitata TaxID=48799 RepID=A0A915PSW1_9BILA
MSVWWSPVRRRVSHLCYVGPACTSSNRRGWLANASGRMMETFASTVGGAGRDRERWMGGTAAAVTADWLLSLVVPLPEGPSVSTGAAWRWVVCEVQCDVVYVACPFPRICLPIAWHEACRGVPLHTAIIITVTVDPGYNGHSHRSCPDRSGWDAMCVVLLCGHSTLPNSPPQVTWSGAVHGPTTLVTCISWALSIHLEPVTDILLIVDLGSFIDMLKWHLAVSLSSS